MFSARTAFLPHNLGNEDLCWVSITDVKYFWNPVHCIHISCFEQFGSPKEKGPWIYIYIYISLSDPFVSRQSISIPVLHGTSHCKVITNYLGNIQWIKYLWENRKQCLYTCCLSSKVKTAQFDILFFLHWGRIYNTHLSTCIFIYIKYTVNIQIEWTIYWYVHIDISFCWPVHSPHPPSTTRYKQFFKTSEQWLFWCWDNWCVQHQGPF